MNLKEIDLDRLQVYAFTPDELAMSPMCSRDKFINLKCLDNESIIPTVQAIPLEELQAMRKEMKSEIYIEDNSEPVILADFVLKTIDEYIEKAKQS